MNGPSMSYPNNGENLSRNGGRVQSSIPTTSTNNNYHRPPRVRFPDDGPTTGSYPRLHGNNVHFDCDSFHANDDNDNLIDTLFGFFAFWLTMICACGMMTILVVLYLTVRPFSLKVYRRLAAHMSTSLFIDALALLLPNTRLIVTGDSDIPTPIGSSILICNHLLDGDWWAILMLGRCVGFKGTIKAFLRNEFLQINLDDVDQVGHQQSSPTSAGTTNQTGSWSSGNGLQADVNQNPSRIISTISNGGNYAASGNACLLQSVRQQTRPPPSDLSLMAKLLHLFLEFPLLNGDESGSPDREKMFSLLRSFAMDNAATTAPVHLLLFPEGWSSYNDQNGRDSETNEYNTALARQAILAKSNEFAKREGKPQLKCLLLPRTRMFNASLECLRQSNPFVYDITLAYSGYNGSLPTSIQPLSITSLFFKVLRRKFPKEVHIRVKRYSVEEVLHIENVNWLVKKWAEKDRLLSHFARHQQFPTDSRGYYGRPRVFNTRYHSLESSVGSLFCLIILTAAVPVFMLVSVPLFWTVLWIWVVTKACQLVFEFVTGNDNNLANGSDVGNGRHTPGSVPSAAGTPFFPATPFASPNFFNWSHGMFAGSEGKSN